MASRRLLRAASAGDVDAVDALLRDGADPGHQVRPDPAVSPDDADLPNAHSSALTTPSRPPTRPQDRKGGAPRVLACERGPGGSGRSLLAAGAPWCAPPPLAPPTPPAPHRRRRRHHRDPPSPDDPRVSRTPLPPPRAGTSSITKATARVSGLPRAATPSSPPRSSTTPSRLSWSSASSGGAIANPTSPTSPTRSATTATISS